MDNVLKKEELIILYEKFGSIKNVATYLNIKYNTLHYYFKKYKIGNYKCKGTALTKEELIELHNKFGSITKIAAELSFSYATIRSWFEYYNITINTSNMNIYHELRDTPMSAQQISVLIGSMLGDGCFRKSSKCKNALLEISHCEKQLPYLKWKHDLMRPYSRPIKLHEVAGPKIICNRLTNISNFYRFHTIVHPDITNLFYTYYRSGFKGVNTSLVDNVNLLAMAIWFGDDGTIQRDNKGVPKLCNICTNSFTYKEHLILVDIVKKFFEGTIKIVKRDSDYIDGKHYFMIQMTGKRHVCAFLELIKTILPECIHYKLS